MARRPYFSGNYGSALGSYDTAAKLIAQAGATQGQMLNNLGTQLGGAISSSLEKFRLNKEKKEKEQRAENQFLNLYEGNPENPIFKNLGIQSTDEAKAVAKDISKDPQLIQQAMQFAQFATTQQQAQEASQLRDLQMQQIQQSMNNQQADRLLAKQNRLSENQFMQSLMSQTASPQAQRQADIAMPGLAALGNGDARNRFMQAQLQQPQNQVPVSSLGSQDFGRFASREGLDPKLSVTRMEALRQAELASQPKPLSPSDQLAREKYEDQKAEDVEQTETAKIESTNNLTDFYNETKSLLDKINEKGVDVTGPIEGTSIYRFFSKLGDTDDEQVRRRLEMFTRKLTLDAAQNLKGALSDKDIRFLVEQAPDMDDNPSVWKKYMGDLVLRLERNANQQGIELGVPQADPSAPASQATLDEIERKKQLRSKRAGL